MKREAIEYTWRHRKNTRGGIVERAKISKRDRNEKEIERNHVC